MDAGGYIRQDATIRFLSYVRGKTPMFRHAFVAVLGLVSLLATQAQAHFLWLDLQPAEGKQAKLYFSEEPEPGEANLIGKAVATKVWLRKADGTTQQVKLTDGQGEEAALVVDGSTDSASSLEGSWDYGVYQRAGGLLLQYYAKSLPGGWNEHPELARSETLKLDVVPSIQGKKLAVQVLYGGQPAADSEVVFVDPAGEHLDLKTDAEGRAQVDATGGRWGVRAAYIESDKAGQRDGKKFSQAWHYSTLVLNVPAGAAVAKTAAKPASAKTPAGDITAMETLVRARDGRAMWTKFPGFSADLTVNSGKEEIKGTMTIDENGTVELEMPASDTKDWVEEQLNTLVQHRMPEGEVAEGNVTFVEEKGEHPLGRLIDLGDGDQASRYRIKDDVLLEVNRSMGPLRFTISVLEIEWNAENKYLPRSFTMNFFDAKSGELKSSLGYFNSWKRVESFDLPDKIIEVDAQKGGASTREIVFSNCKLIAK